jgi:hypothetical protein
MTTPIKFVVVIAAPFFHSFPLPPPADRRLRAAFVDGRQRPTPPPP